MKELFTLGELYVSDFLGSNDTPRGGKVEMKMMMTEDGNVRLEKAAPQHVMYGKYWYRSGINQTMKNELKGIVESILSVKKIKIDVESAWLDIACNDGTLLSFIPPEIFRVGIDPVDDSYKNESEQHSDIIVQDYFSKEALSKGRAGGIKYDVITTIAMFYDLENPKPFVEDIVNVLKDDGLWVVQLSYTPLMLKQLAFDNICHEHIYYYSLFNIKKLFNECGLDIVDVQLNDINGGSFRIYAMKSSNDKTSFGTQPHRDVCNFRVNSLLEYEKTLKLDKVETWTNFFLRINLLKKSTVSFIKSVKEEGKSVWGYGASTKGNTLLQYFGLDHTLIDGIAERSPYKYGLKTVGTNIPITCEDTMRKAKPDYLLVLPWHFINEFVQREKEFLDGGGKFIIPCPKFEVIGR